MSSRDLKVLNGENAQVLRDIFVNCGKVIVFKTQKNDLIAVGSYGSYLTVVSPLSTAEPQVIDFGSPITLFLFHNEKIHVLLDTDEIQQLTSSNGKWTPSSAFHYKGSHLKLLGFFPFQECFVLAFQSTFSIRIAFSVKEQHIHNVGDIDCLKDHTRISISTLPAPFVQGHVILFGTEDGHVYRLSHEVTEPIFLCDLQQPVLKIFCFLKYFLVVGKFGKIVRLDATSQRAAVCYAPTCVDDCQIFNYHVYIQSPESFLYSIQLDIEDFKETIMGEIKYSHIKFVRAFSLNDGQVIVLTESGTIYQTSPNFSGGNPKSKPTGSEVKPLLEEIHRKADELDELNRLNADVYIDLAQLSTALHLVGENLSNKFEMEVLGYAYPGSTGKERLVVKITNNSEWNFVPSHWSLQLFTNHDQQMSFPLLAEWESNETLELHLTLDLKNDVFQTKLESFLVFRIAISQVKQAEPQVACAFPMNSIQLGVLDFLEPSGKDQTPLKSVQHDFIGFSKRKIHGDNPWPVLLKRSWHRGFAQLLTEQFPVDVCLSYSTQTIKLTLKEEWNQFEQLWIMKLETDNAGLLRHLRSELAQVIRDSQPTVVSKASEVRIPSTAQFGLQSLKGRLNYVRSIKNCNEKDLEPLMEQVRQLFAKEFYIR